MKKLVLALLLTAFVSAANAQTADAVGKSETKGIFAPAKVQMFEGELFGGFAFPADSYHNGNGHAGFNFGLAMRHNIKGTGFDCGIMADFTAVRRTFPDLSKYDDDQTNRTLTIALTGAYNFMQGRKVNPFVGVGVGIGFMDCVGDRPYPVEGVNAVVVPKIGVELWSFLRIYASSHIVRKGFNSLEVGIGFVLGGRPKK